jgi:hypothetical protein
LRVKLKNATDMVMPWERGQVLRKVVDSSGTSLTEVLLDSGKVRTYYPSMLEEYRSSDEFDDLGNPVRK